MIWPYCLVTETVPRNKYVSNGSNIMRDAKMYSVRNMGMYLSRFRHFFAQTYTSSWFLAGIISTLARPLVKVEHVLSSWLKKEFESLWCFSVYREWSGMGKKSDIFFLMSCSTYLQDILILNLHFFFPNCTFFALQFDYNFTNFSLYYSSSTNVAPIFFQIRYIILQLQEHSSCKQPEG